MVPSRDTVYVFNDLAELVENGSLGVWRVSVNATQQVTGAVLGVGGYVKFDAVDWSGVVSAMVKARASSDVGR